MTTRNNWFRMSSTSPCPICKKPDWWSVSIDGSVVKCMRVEQGCWRSGTDRTGARYYLHRIEVTARSHRAPPPPPGSQPQLAGTESLHSAYSALLAGLHLSKADREALKRR